MDEYIDIVKGTGMIDEDSMPETLAILAQYHSMLEEEHTEEFLAKVWGLSVCRLLFNSFSKLKIDENYKEKRRLFY